MSGTLWVPALGTGFWSVLALPYKAGCGLKLRFFIVTPVKSCFTILTKVFYKVLEKVWPGLKLRSEQRQADLQGQLDTLIPRYRSPE